jgi:putative ABC transport system permease protein
MQLTSEHIDYIVKDLNYRGIVLDGFQDELIDHVCSAVERRLVAGQKFIDAYHEVIKDFGNTNGLRQTQLQTIENRNQRTKNMIRNYFVIAFRNLMKHRFYTFINIACLAIGIASCLIIMLYVSNETGYDKHHANAHRIYRVNSEIKFGPNHLMLAVAPAPTAETMLRDFPEVEVSARFWNSGSSLVKRTDENFKENNTVFADSSIFKIFTIPFIAGNPDNALTEPNSVVISKYAADKYFPNENALGQTLIVDNTRNLKVTGVIENMPMSGHFRFDFLISLVSDDYNRDQNWLSNNFNTYVLLREGADPKDLEAKLPTMIETYAGPQAKMALGADFTMEKFRAAGNKLDYTLMPVTDIHLHSDRTAELGMNSSASYVYLFSAVALFILVIACINFMNLSTARSANRAKEVGIRKVMGSFRSHLVRQFLTESVMLSAVSFILAIGLAWLAIPAFNDLARKSLEIPFGDSTFWLIVAGAALAIGLLAGVYPSLFLSAFKPVNVLKGNLSLGMKSGMVRSSLVVFQFWISITLIVGTIAVNRQLNFIQNKNVGFNKDQVLVVKNAYGLGDKVQSFKEEALKDSRIISGTVSGFLPVSGTNRSDNTHWPEGKQPTDENMVSLQCWRVDHDYVKTLGMKIIEGRDFSKEFPSDSGAVILNQAAAKMFGYNDEAVGRKISTFEGATTDAAFNPSAYEHYNIVGVVEDFHFESLKENITPLAFFLSSSRGLVSFRFEAKNTSEVIESIEATWKKISPGMPFSYSFLDDDFGTMYSAEQQLGQIFTIFAGLAIVIACLGLFALTAFTAEQRTKEIGIRKVLGASVSSVVLLLSREFGKLIVIAFVLSAPVAWYGIDMWLQEYEYRTTIGIAVYLVAGVAAFAVAWLTMSFQSIRAALSNPVNSLRSQ